MDLTDEQQAGIELCTDLSKKIVSVTGQAGTGKTTILKKAVEAIREDNPIFKDTLWSEAEQRDFQPIQLCAPTGRAAERIKEATGIEAMTIHRLLRFSMPEEEDDDFGLPAYTKMNKMPYRVIFVDEASMITHSIRRSLLDAMNNKCVIRFFGDINQLPPIPSSKDRDKPLSPFYVDLDKFPSITLTQNFRSVDGIIDVSDKIIKGKIPVSNDKVSIRRTAQTAALSDIKNICKEIDFTRNDNQIICPTNDTKFGTKTINRIIQQAFNPEKDKITIYRSQNGELITRAFKRGDKIVWEVNDYNVGIMNGTLGRVLDFDKYTGTMLLHVNGIDREIPSSLTAYNSTTGENYEYDPRQRLNLGYAISTHKSQGSQFDTVCYVLSRTRAASRQNVYTALTRAKNKLIIVNIAGSLNKALMNLVDLEAKGNMYV